MVYSSAIVMTFHVLSIPHPPHVPSLTPVPRVQYADSPVKMGVKINSNATQGRIIKHVLN